MSYELKKMATHPNGKWTLYTIQPENAAALLETSPSNVEAEYRRLDKTRHEARKGAKVRRESQVAKVTEKTSGDLSF